MIRTSLLLLFTGGLAFYARRDWFIAVCGALLLMAVVQHPDMLRNVGGIQGLNPWNLLMLSVIVNWLAQRKKEGLVWDLPTGVTWLLVLYGSVVTVAFLRMIVDRRNIEHISTAFLVSEHLVNCVKWVIPSLILYDACRTRRRVIIALLAVLGIYFLLALQVIRWMPLSTAMSGESLSYRASKIIQNEVGYNRVNMSMLLAGGSWAIAAAAILVKRWQLRFLMLGAAATVALGQALTGGRTGYGVWAVIGITFGLLRWRKLLAIVPVLAVLVLTLIPGVSERLFQGFGGRQGTAVVEADEYEITSGRNVAWPLVIAEIEKAPVFGYGRLAMNRLGISMFLLNDLGEDFAHPHNVYLETLLDSGVVGLVLILPFYLFVLWRALLLFRDRSDDLSAAAGGVALALVLALLIAGIGSQTFYPREGSVGMWAAIGIMMRVSVEKRRALATGISVFDVRDSAPAKRQIPLGGTGIRTAAALLLKWHVKSPLITRRPEKTSLLRLPVSAAGHDGLLERPRQTARGRRRRRGDQRSERIGHGEGPNREQVLAQIDVSPGRNELRLIVGIRARSVWKRNDARTDATVETHST